MCIRDRDKKDDKKEDKKDSKAKKGVLCLQDHGYPASFRNIKIKELPRKSKEVNLFNGVDPVSYTHLQGIHRLPLLTFLFPVTTGVNRIDISSACSCYFILRCPSCQRSCRYFTFLMSR